MQTARSEAGAAIQQCRGMLMATAFFSFFVNLLQLVAPLFMLQVYDRVLQSRSGETLVALVVIAIVLLIVMGLLEAIRSRVLVRMGGKIDQLIGGRLLQAVLEVTNRTGRGQEAQVLRDLETLRGFMTTSGIFALFDSPWVPIFLFVMFLFHPMIGAVGVVGAIVLFSLALATEMRTRDPLKLASFHASRANDFAETSRRNAEVVQSLGMIGGVRRKWQVMHDTALNLQAIASDRAGSITGATRAFRFALQIAILAVGAYYVLQHQITPGVMIAGSIIMGRALAPVEQAIGIWRQFIQSRAAYARIKELLAKAPPRAPSMPLPVPKGQLSVDKIVFGHPGGKPILKGVSFTLEPGESLGIIGPSAAGKSTIARILAGAWLPLAGTVRLDGVDLSAWDREDAGKYIGYLPQDVELFGGTVKENIARFQDAEPDQIIEAARKADVHEMVLHLPKGYETEIGESGSSLSGGQRQRLGLARALFGNPRFMVLDEPNSNLDTDGEEALRQTLLQLKEQGVTVVVIAHRPSILSVVDKVLLLRDGLPEMFGPRADVLAKLTRPVATPGGTPPRVTQANRPGVRPVAAPESPSDGSGENSSQDDNAKPASGGGEA
ncbi:MAG: type I secretion system permease/ATPase [Alphaproteobacteria bacterium]|nr:type I secretion system permease/ATPase [Alphaproteobacteria bacterium]MBU0796421.1 type I secretion system permease/ATPase [Alphaproteobacteria bacterium]MBU0886772.1 type I secretion system permease/ATPase [Alphaproteobacteria bacterium]MBU1812615.1 type I secretion system permease/ATPase [Alphaproteobacteria bacterium]MBU2091932.1 type I secretion system permease/ATPase [Alphaproteobacteria bacterium]